jgi:hypothetical protein
MRSTLQHFSVRQEYQIEAHSLESARLERLSP